MAAVESLFSDEQGLSFKELACRLMQLIRTTLQQVYLMFSSPSSSLSANNHVVDLAMESVSLGDLHLGYWSRFLPASLQDFQPASSTSLYGRLSQDDIHTQCAAFLAKCVSVVPSSLSSALSYVTSMESLVSVRDAVYDMLAKDDSVLNQDSGHATISTSISTSSFSTHTGAAIVPSGLPHWDVVCTAVVGRQVILYDELIRNNLQTRMQEIIATQLSTACSAIHESVLALLADMHAMTSSGSSMTSSSHAVATSTTSGGDMLSTGWLDRNVGAYIWQDSADDLLPTLSTSSVSTAATQPARPSSVSSMRRSPDGTGAVSVLAMKTRGVTPAAARAYSEFNSSLSALLSGVRLAVGDTNTSSAAATTPIARWKPTFGEEITKVECVPFKKFACAAELRSFLRMTSYKTTSELLSKFQNRLQQLREEAEDTSSLSSADRARSVDCCLLLARLSSSLFECCPPLEACLLGLEKSSAKDSTTSRSRRSLSTRSTSLSLKSDMRSQPDQEQLNNVRNDINKLTMDAYSVWTSSTVSTMMSSLRHCILSENPRVLLSYAVAWEEIKIEEEGEEGRKVESTIRLPMQICNALGSAMFLLCEEISRVGGHTVSATVQQSLIRMFGDRLLDVFEQLLTGGGDGDGVADAGNTQRSSAIVFSRRLPQPRALQCLFDIKCCATLLAGRGAKAGDSAAYNSRVRAVISWLESCIDPFDLDVFEPYLASNLSRCVQRCSSLYGALYSQAKGSSSNFVGGASALAAAASSGLSTGGKSSSQEQHNVIPMATAINRLPLLPVGTGMTTAAAAQISMDRINTARPPPPKLGVFVAMPELEQRMQLFSLPAAGSNNSNTTQQS
ncbi:conserved oligomeric Golgi complex subunit 1-like [Sycon ciliatum]|uniref:conserved oligomeric Golgi complex subunit 1-like n=1 Tax=Sycon ciliatum TaxID=27933 RepID=UPI0031F6F9FD